MDLIERHENLAILDKLASDSLRNRGNVVLLTGPVASGKTALLHGFGERLTDADVLVLTATCASAESSLVCGVLGQLLLHSAPLPAALTTLRNRITTLSNQDDPELLPLLNALCLQLMEFSARQPLLICVDDVQHGDPASLEFLKQLARRVRSSRILVLLTTEEDCAHRHSTFLAELYHHPHFHRVTMSPLSPGGVCELVSRQLGDTVSRRLAAEFHAATGGNMALLHAIIKDHGDPADTEVWNMDVAVPEYQRAFVTCLRRTGRHVLDVARGLALLDADRTQARLVQVTGLDGPTVDHALRYLDAAGLLHAGRFRHPAARSAVIDDIPADLRGRLHAGAAEVLHDTGGVTATVAMHLREAGSTPPQWAARVLADAAELAISDDRQQQATTYLQLALRAQPQSQPRTAAVIRARLAELEWRQCPESAGDHIAALTGAVRARHLDWQDAARLTRQLLWYGRMDEASSMLDLIRAEPAEQGAEGGVPLRALEEWLGYAYPPLARRSRLSASANAGYGGVATPPLDPWLLGMATLAELDGRGRVADAVERADQLLRDLLLGHHTGWAEESALAAIGVLVRADQLDDATDWCTRLASKIDSERPDAWQAMFSAARSEIAMHQGDLIGARDHARSALALVSPTTWGVGIGLPLANLILAQARLGCVDGAAAALALPVPDAMFHSRYGLLYLHARGHYHLITRHHHNALADFLACGKLVRDWGVDTAGLVPWRVGAAEAWLRVDNRDQARRLISEQLSRPAGHSPRYRAQALRQLAATSPVSRRTPILTESLELFESCGDRYEQARTLADLSGAYHALNETRRARMLFRRAVHLAELCQADTLYRELLSSTGELAVGEPTGDDTDRLSVLSGSERRVASLATMGYSNREIAGKLYVTSSTVEQHLTRVYRKLNIKQRRELPVVLSPSGR